MKKNGMSVIIPKISQELINPGKMMVGRCFPVELVPFKVTLRGLGVPMVKEWCLTLFVSLGSFP